MMLGNRLRPPMKRTTSMKEFSGDIIVDVDVAGQPTDQEMMDSHHNQLYDNQLQQKNQPREPEKAVAQVAYWRAAVEGETRLGSPDMGVGDWSGANYMASTVQRRGVHRRNSVEFAVLETGSFLRNCGLCRRRLGPGKDIFMYRGDIAFCSLECRQQRMNLDEMKEKCSLTSMKETSTASSVSEQSSSDGTVIAA